MDFGKYPGEKIKDIAPVLLIVGIVGSIIMGVVGLVMLSIVFIVFAVIMAFCCYIGALFIYAFGQMAQDIQILRERVEISGQITSARQLSSQGIAQSQKTKNEEIDYSALRGIYGIKNETGGSSKGTANTAHGAKPLQSDWVCSRCGKTNTKDWSSCPACGNRPTV